MSLRRFQTGGGIGSAQGAPAQDEVWLLEPLPTFWAEPLPQVARQSLQAALFEVAESLPATEGTSLATRQGVFVTIRGPGDELRGCVGTLLPRQQNVVEETRQMAFAAAFADRRFPPVTWEEFPDLRFEVSVVGPLEEVKSEEELDPQHYGVIVRAADGREGCLLPGIPEITTVQRQLELVRAKAGIESGEPVRVRRFKAIKLQESEDARRGGCMLNVMMNSNHPADWWVRLPDDRIECQLCPRLCKLREGQRGFCFVRQRRDNRMVLTTYGSSTGLCVDPIEKKPLHHFYPGSSVLSLGTVGCNLGCRFCQNWQISKSGPFRRRIEPASEDAIVKAAQKLGCRSVAFTYNDPVIFAEYAMDVAVACQKANLQTVAVTAGYVNAEPRAEFFRHIDAANVDWKGFTESFYGKFCFGRMAPVLETLEYLHQETNVWLEVTSLLIPGENDDERQLHWASEWFAEHLGPDVPWHFTAFHPDFKMLDKPSTPLTTLEKARTIALSKGLRYVYTGNVCNPAGSSTYCPECRRLLIGRDGYEIGTWNLMSGRCRFCGCFIAGNFESHPEFRNARHTPVRLS